MNFELVQSSVELNFELVHSSWTSSRTQSSKFVQVQLVQQFVELEPSEPFQALPASHSYHSLVSPPKTKTKQTIYNSFSGVSGETIN